MAPRKYCVNFTAKPRRVASIKPAAPCNLGGLSVLVTRPMHQADKLCALIEAAHGRPIRFPALEIVGPVDKTTTRDALLAARRCDLLIFVSTNAVDYAYPLLPDQLPADVGIRARAHVAVAGPEHHPGGCGRGRQVELCRGVDEVAGVDLGWFFDQVLGDDVTFDYGVASAASRPASAAGSRAASTNAEASSG